MPSKLSKYFFLVLTFPIINIFVLLFKPQAVYSANKVQEILQGAWELIGERLVSFFLEDFLGNNPIVLAIFGILLIIFLIPLIISLFKK